MAATTDQLRKSIDPGSIPQGRRAGLEQALGQIGGGGQMAPRAATAAQGSLGVPSSPLDPLTGQELPPGEGELTAGLSVGPGPGPQADESPDSRMERLRLIALNAQSPVLREAARRSLRSTVRSRRSGG